MAEYTNVAKVAEIPVGSAKVVEVNGKKIALFHVADQFYALDDRCSHAEASLAKGYVEDGSVSCPLHGARFCLKTGKNLCLPAVTPVSSYEVKVEGEDIYLGGCP